MTASEPKHRKRRVAADEAHSWARNLRLKNPFAKLVLSMLTLYVNGDGACFVGATALAEDCELAIETVRRRLTWLETIGAIVRLPQWLDEHGRRNSAGHGKRTSDEIRLMLDANIDEIEQKAWGHADDSDKVSTPSGRGLATEPIELTRILPAPYQPPHCGGGLISEPEPEPEDSPQPPSGGASVADDGWKEFERDWTEPILRQSIAHQVWSALTPDERKLARKAARGYVAWRKGQRKPPPVSNAQTFLKEREAWAGFAKYDPGEPSEQRAAPALIFVVEGSPEWRALGVVAEIAGTKPPQAIFHDEGRGIKLRETLSPAQLALEQFADVPSSDWKLVHAGTHQCGAWRKFLGIDVRAITTGFTTKEINGRTVDDWPIKETGLRVPCDWPPRKDGTLSTTGPPPETYMTEADVRDLDKLKAG